MMTPTAKTQFKFKFILKNGKECIVNHSVVYGGYSALQTARKWGLNVSQSTLMRAKKPREYWIADYDSRQELIAKAYFAASYGATVDVRANGGPEQVATVHLIFQRIN